MMETKGCSKCRRNLPISSFCKDEQKKNKLSSACKECKNKLKRERYVPHPIVYNKEEKTCNNCATIKLVAEFKKYREKERKKKGRYSNKCLVCLKI